MTGAESCRDQEDRIRIIRAIDAGGRIRGVADEGGQRGREERRGVVKSGKSREILSRISILFAKRYKKFLANVQFLNSSVQATLPRTFVLLRVTGVYLCSDGEEKNGGAEGGEMP